jgi:alginate O-acetyltransferase complex protein AlgJ
MWTRIRLIDPRAIVARLFIAAFFVLLWLPLADSALHLDPTPMLNENRALAPVPDFNPGKTGWRTCFSSWEAYHRDHFGFRNQLVKRGKYLKRKWFGESSLNSDVICGKQGWLYFIGDNMLDNYVGAKNLSAADLKNWQRLLEKRRDWLAARGIKYLYVVPPDKHTVYPEYLPAWVVKRRAPSKLDQFLTHMKTHSTVPVLDMRPALLAAKTSVITYLLTDTHWNYYGGFAGYEALLGALSAQLPGLRPALPMSAFEWKFEQQPGGDCAILLGRADTMVEPHSVVLSVRPPLQPPVLRTVTERLPKEWLPKTEPVVLECADQTGKAVIFRDSFAGAWAQFLAHHFRETLYIWQYEWDAAFIEREKPDVVIDEILERFFNIQDPVSLMQRDALPGNP